MSTEPEPHRRFDAAAGAYGRARPAYPAELVDWLVAEGGLGAGDRVLDLAAGTGELTARLLDAGLDVAAVEPSPEMRRILAERHPGLEITSDVAERLSAADRTFALVTVANALHWLDPRSAFPEVHRVLRPAGHFTVVWHLPDRSNRIQDRLWSIVEELHLDAHPYPGPDPGLPPDWGDLFEAGATRGFEFVHRLPRDLLPDYVASWSGVANMDPGERDALLERVRGWSVEETVELPFRVTALLGLATTA